MVLEFLNNLATGFSTAATIQNLLYCFFGVTLGTLVGVLPGFGPLATMSILFPLIYTINDPTTAIIFLAGIYYGTQYGGSTTSILMRLPGEAASVVTMIEGYEMTKKGRSGAAISISALGSFFAGTVATIFVAKFAEPLAKFSLSFTPQDYVGLMVIGLLASVTLSKNDMINGLSMVLLGMLLATVGTDLASGEFRYTFGLPDLMDGVNFGLIAMGMFGLAEIFWNTFNEEQKKVTASIKLRDLYPTKKEFTRSVPPIFRGTLIGSLLGVLPGGGVVLSSFASYAAEKKISKHPEEFGKGAIEGVAGPESANNAAAQCSFIPMLSLGLPVTPTMSLVLAALLLNNITPGPNVVTENSTLFWGLIASMWIGNIMLLILNLPLVGVWVSVLKIPRIILFSIITFACLFGAYTLHNNWFDVMMLIPLALVGYFLKYLNCEPAPLAMGFVVGDLLEEYLRRTLIINHGEWSVFFTTPFPLIVIILISSTFMFKLYSLIKK